MQVSREYALNELDGAKKAIGLWIKELKTPSRLLPDGTSVPIYQDGVPVGLSVSSVEGIPTDQLRAELLALSGKLEALAMAVV